VNERFWPGFRRTADRNPQAPTGRLAALQESISAIPPAESERWLREARNHATDRVDTHPALSDRLAGLACPPPSTPPPPAPSNAAESWLGPLAERLERQLDATWSAGLAIGWAEHHRQVAEALAQRDALAGKRARGEATCDERWELARLTHELEDPQAAEPLLEEVLHEKPDHAPAAFTLGCLRIEADDERGVQLLEVAMRAEGAATVAACERIALFHDRRGQRTAAKDQDRRAWERGAAEQLAAEERRSPTGKPLKPHEVDPGLIAAACEAMGRVPEIAVANLAAVVVKHLPDRPFLVLAITTRRSWWSRNAAKDLELCRALTTALVLPGDWFVIVARGETAALAKRVAKQPGARIYERGTERLRRAA
nr:hypothetical protein [Planctomycetota bacterium]